MKLIKKVGLLNEEGDLIIDDSLDEETREMVSAFEPSGLNGHYVDGKVIIGFCEDGLVVSDSNNVCYVFGGIDNN